jgi:hypothetical protein
METKTISNKKKSFVLKNISVNDIIKKFNLVLPPKIPVRNCSSTIINNYNTSFLPLTTHISQIIEKEPELAYSFYDEKKKLEACNVTMINHSSLNAIACESNICCFWCRHTFNSSSIGCPIRYVNSIMEKTYTSNITNEKYFMKENLTSQKFNVIQSLKNDVNRILYEKNYYLVDGIFCSFNCVAAFIQDNKKNPLYKESYALMKSLYFDLMGFHMKSLYNAPHWRLLKSYGGHMSIEEFRKSFHNQPPQFLFTLSDKSCLKDISTVFKILKNN